MARDEYNTAAATPAYRQNTQRMAQRARTPEFRLKAGGVGGAIEQAQTSLQNTVDRVRPLAPQQVSEGEHSAYPGPQQVLNYSAPSAPTAPGVRQTSFSGRDADRFANAGNVVPSTFFTQSNAATYGGDNTSARQQSQPLQPPPGLRRAQTFASADGGASPPESLAWRRNRERQLMEQLPRRTSEWKRDLLRREARMRGGDPNAPGMTRAAREAAVAHAAGLRKSLDSRFREEDAMYQTAFNALSNRLDTGVEGDLARQNVLDNTNLKEEGETTREGMDQYGQTERTGMRQSGENYRSEVEARTDRYGDDTALAQTQARMAPQQAESDFKYGEDGEGGAADQQFAVEQRGREASNKAAERGVQNELFKRSMGGYLQGVPEDEAEALIEAIPEEIRQIPNPIAQQDAAAEWIARKAMERAGSVRGESPWYSASKRLGEGALEGMEFQGRASLWDSFKATFDPHTDISKGDFKYSNNDGREVWVPSDRIPRGIRRAARYNDY